MSDDLSTVVDSVRQKLATYSNLPSKVLQRSWKATNCRECCRTNAIKYQPVN